MLKGWNYFKNGNSVSPFWAKDYFKGINMKELSLQSLFISSIDFSYSTFGFLIIRNCILLFVSFQNCIIKDGLNFNYNKFNHTKFDNLILNKLENFHIYDTTFDGTKFPSMLVSKINPLNKHIDKEEISYLKVGKKWTNIALFQYFKPFFEYGIKSNLFEINQIKLWFIYGRDEDKKEFEGLIDGLKDV